MKIKINTAPLREALAAMSRVIPAKSTVDILKGVLVYCEDQDVKLAGTSPHGDLIVELGIHYHAPFRFAVEASRLRMFVDRANAEIITFDVPDASMADGGGQMTINGGNTRGKLNLLSAKDFPKFAEPKGEMSFEAEFDIANAIGRVSWATGTNIGAKPVLQGLSIIADDEQTIRVFATTGVVASTLKLQLEKENLDLKKAGYIILQRETAAMIGHVFKNAAIQAYGGRALILVEGYRMSVPLLESGEKFIAMPKVEGETLSANTKVLADSLAACAAMADGAKQIIVSAVEGKGADGFSLKLTGAGTHGEMEQELSVESTGTGLDVHLNAGQVMAALRACPSDTVKVLVPQGDGAHHKAHKLIGGNWEALIMPVKK